MTEPPEPSEREPVAAAADRYRDAAGGRVPVRRNRLTGFAVNLRPDAATATPPVSQPIGGPKSGRDFRRRSLPRVALLPPLCVRSAAPATNLRAPISCCDCEHPFESPIVVIVLAFQQIEALRKVAMLAYERPHPDKRPHDLNKRPTACSLSKDARQHRDALLGERKAEDTDGFPQPDLEATDCDLKIRPLIVSSET